MQILLKRLAILVLGSIPLIPCVQADQFVTGQTASSVLGQTTFTAQNPGSAPNRFKNPESVAVDPTTGKVFVGDSENYRVLRFSSTAALANGSYPEAVIGQPNFTSVLPNQGGAAAANTLNFCYQITVDKLGRLWIADSANNRVLCYIAASLLTNNPPADFVFGQPDFTTTSPDTTSTKMDFPCGVAIGPDDSLWVADADNNRVLRFSNISTKASAAAANQVLGQADFVSSSSNIGASGMSNPYSVSTDTSGRLWVVDTSNNRVLRFDTAAALVNGSPANAVLGQPDFTSNSTNTTATGFDSPYGLLIGHEGTLFVGDYSNRRVMGFRNAAEKSTGAAADFVLGQANFTTKDATPSPTRLGGPVNLSMTTDGSLFVADYQHHRVLRYVPVKSPIVAITTKKQTTKKTKIKITGTASGAVTRINYRVGSTGGFKTATGTTNWSFRTPLKKGKNKIIVYALGPGGISTLKLVTIKRKKQ